MLESGEPKSDESSRHSKLEWMTNHLPPFPNKEQEPWVWGEDETAMLRAACAARFDETLRTESLYCIAATAIRIYMGRIKYAENDAKVKPLHELANEPMTNFNK